jgi:hypothetical protein
VRETNKKFFKLKAQIENGMRTQ